MDGPRTAVVMRCVTTELNTKKVFRCAPKQLQRPRVENEKWTRLCTFLERMRQVSRKVEQTLVTSQFTTNKIVRLFTRIFVHLKIVFSYLYHIGLFLPPNYKTYKAAFCASKWWNDWATIVLTQNICQIVARREKFLFVQSFVPNRWERPLYGSKALLDFMISPSHKGDAWPEHSPNESYRCEPLWD